LTSTLVSLTYRTLLLSSFYCLWEGPPVSDLRGTATGGATRGAPGGSGNGSGAPSAPACQLAHSLTEKPSPWRAGAYPTLCFERDAVAECWVIHYHRLPNSDLRIRPSGSDNPLEGTREPRFVIAAPRFSPAQRRVTGVWGICHPHSIRSSGRSWPQNRGHKHAEPWAPPGDTSPHPLASAHCLLSPRNSASALKKADHHPDIPQSSYRVAESHLGILPNGSDHLFSAHRHLDFRDDRQPSRDPPSGHQRRRLSDSRALPRNMFERSESLRNLRWSPQQWSTTLIAWVEPGNREYPDIPDNPPAGTLVIVTGREQTSP